MDVDGLDDAVMADVNLDDAVMADAMAMDDLFGETNETLELATGVHLPSIAAPLPPALLLRLADMQTSGCCTKLAWSKSGSIARISDNGTMVEFFVYITDPKSGKWKLSGPSSHTINTTDHIFVHLEFNLLGHDLAITDAIGQVHLYSLVGGIGKMQASLSTVDEAVHERNELDTIVGLHWLPVHPQDCKALYIGPVSRSVTGWTSQSRPREPSAVKVHHPSDGAKALLSVTRKGLLALRFQQEGWRSISHALHGVEDLISHASFCEHNGNILLAAYDTAKCLNLYEIALTWNATYAPGPAQSHQVTAVEPRLQVMLLTSTLDTFPRHSLALYLTQLKLLPQTAEVVDSNLSTTTTVLATFVQTASPSDALAQFNDSATILVRWQVEADPRVLHESFGKLRPAITPSSITVDRVVLRRQPDLISPKVLLSIRPEYFDTMLLCIASDGTIEVRDRASFDVLEPYMDTDHVTNMVQSGFAYDVSAHNVHAASSSDGSAMVSISPDTKLKVSNMTFGYGWQSADGSMADTSYQLAEAGIVCIARQYMIMTCSYFSPEEVLSVLPAALPDELRQLLVREAFRLARAGPDISAYDERMRQGLAMGFREPLMSKAYGLQLAVGTDLARSERSLSGQLAWAVLNLRHICWSVQQSMARLDPTQPLPSAILHSLRGQCRWTVDLMTMLIGSLLSVLEKSKQDPSQPARKFFGDYMKDSKGPMILLLLCSLPRTLIKLLTHAIPRLIKFSALSSSRARTVLERQQLYEIGMLEKTVPFDFSSLKTFLDAVETTMRTVSQDHVAIGSSSSQSADTVMSISGTIPEELESRLRALLVTTIPTLLDAAELSKIYFTDTSWLGLGGSGSVQAAQRYDVLSKLPLREHAAVRKCRRCGSMMEDLNMDKPSEIMPWVLHTQRNCICACNWYIP